ncbi:hypothetical protein [Clostridium weizhouense]|uniref:DUF304 domain-containing protein n=1 Tax=Clostridium weizhouense TaxID=2859781 RepID=A0ABS7AUF9_9CLOT|nr:hypothetical protein [Clostridium weizhouense]MBW6411883.1 hypothetical protein [Clostridium weizhouense]
MESIELPYIIKPIIIKKYIVILYLIIFIMILFASVHTGKFDSVMFISQSIIMSLTLYISYKVTFRTIEVKNDSYTYKGLTKAITVDYKSISRIGILVRKGKNNSYSLILVGKENWQISNIEKYRKKDIEFLIDSISIKNNEIAKISDEFKKNNLIEVNWIHDKN